MMRLFPSPRERAPMLEILRTVRDLTLVRPGCLGCWLYEEESLPCHIRYGEQWASEDDLYQHLGSELYRRILAAIELSHRPPEIQFHFVSQTRGMELIEAVRTSSEPAGIMDR